MVRFTPMMLFLVASGLILACAGCVTGAAREHPQIAPERLDKIKKALGMENWSLARRALLEATQVDHPDTQLVKAILRSEEARRMSLIGLTLRVLGNASGESAEEVIRTYRGDPERNVDLLPALGRMGKNAVGAVPYLRGRLTDPNLRPEQKTTINVVLACMGQATPVELGEIAEELNQKEGRAQVIQAMFYAGRNEWVTEAVKDSLLKALGQGKEQQVWAIFALMTLGRKTDRTVVEGLTHVYDTQTDGIVRVWSGLAVAAVDSNRRHAAMQKAFLALYLEYGNCLTREISNLPDLFYSAVGDAAFAKEAASLVSHKDPRIATAAVSFLEIIGPATKGVTPKLIRILETAEEDDDDHPVVDGAEDLRDAAAEALGMVAGPSDPPELRKLAKKCKGDIKESLEHSIQIVQLENW